MRLNEKDCELYYCAQSNSGKYFREAQSGNGNYFQGLQFQKGYGFFGDLGRFIIPIALKAGRYLGKQLLRTGGHVLTDVATGAKIGDSARTRIRETGDKVKQDVIQRLQRGRGIKRKRRKGKTQSLSRKRRKKNASNRRRDIFS